jgi:hypothetical protein
MSTVSTKPLIAVTPLDSTLNGKLTFGITNALQASQFRTPPVNYTEFWDSLQLYPNPFSRVIQLLFV